MAHAVVCLVFTVKILCAEVFQVFLFGSDLVEMFLVEFIL